MEIKRKLQLGAVAVVANGLLALTLLSPRPASAAACSDNNYFAGCGCLRTCVVVPGCTATAVCLPFVCGGKGTGCSYT